eukprot:750772-Hanusia_phi.AAC.1
MLATSLGPGGQTPRCSSATKLTATIPDVHKPCASCEWRGRKREGERSGHRGSWGRSRYQLGSELCRT